MLNNIKVRWGGQDIDIKISNLSKIRDLKSTFISESQKTIDVEDVRLFYMGKELKNDFCIYSYDIMDEMTIQAMVKKH